MSGLLPDVIRHAVQSRSIYGASQSFGLVALILLIVLLIEWQILDLRGRGRLQVRAVFALLLPLFVVVAGTVAVRIQHLP